MSCLCLHFFVLITHHGVHLSHFKSIFRLKILNQMWSFWNIRWFIFWKMPTKRKLLSSKKHTHTIVWVFGPGWRSQQADGIFKKPKWPMPIKWKIESGLDHFWLNYILSCLLCECDYGRFFFGTVEEKNLQIRYTKIQNMRQRQECSEAKVWPCDKMPCI